MVSFVQSVGPVSRFSNRTPLALAAALAVLAGGCSADIARFDFASANLNDGSGSTGAIPTPTEPVRQRSNLIGDESASGYGYAPPANGGYAPAPSSPPAVAAAPLADATPPPASSYTPPAPTESARVAALTPSEPSAPPTPPRMAEHADLSRGEQIEVQVGDTLYGLSRRHKVSLNDLMSVNNLTGPNLKPGQRLYVPATRLVQRPVEQPPVVQAAEAPADWTGTHTMQPGESLYALAVRYRTKAADIQRYNGIQDVRRIRPGAVLRVPGGASESTIAAVEPAPAPSVTPPTTAPQGVSGGPSPVILNAAPPAPSLPDATRTDQRIAAAGPLATTSDAAPALGAVPVEPGSGSIASTPKLRWPVEGKIISGFGRRADSTHNDGINLAVPMGTDVHAAEAGTVAYAGSELKGYGNLVLLRHENGWVTAYAHADELLVRRGDVVKRGQVIAKAGKTGQVDQPQVHFELRQGQKPVDPVPFMDKM